MSPADWGQLLLFHLSISLLAVGGAITLVPDLHRFLAGEQHWLTDLQFNQSVTLAQAAHPKIRVVPFESLREMSETDLRALYLYLKALPGKG